MPVFVTCPACGCRVQMTEGMIGQRVRCIACNDRFVADPEVKPPPPPPRRPPVSPRSEPRDGSPLPPRAGEDEVVGPDGRPFCPGCGRRVNWDWVKCFHCGEPFDFDEDPRRRERRFFNRPRRDSFPHRGPMLTNMGNITLAIGALSLCVFGLGAVVTIPLGVTTIVLATGDLNQMQLGLMDPAGRLQTENGRIAAIIGLVLSLLFSAGWALMYLSRF